jgi:CSLREA domain-containing protein
MLASIGFAGDGVRPVRAGTVGSSAAMLIKRPGVMITQRVVGRAPKFATGPSPPKRKEPWNVTALACRLARPVIVVLAAMVVVAGPAAAADIVVNSTANHPDATGGIGDCDTDASSDGLQCTLRAAIQTANDHAGPDVIRFRFGGSGQKTIDVPSGLPQITGAVRIDGYSVQGARTNARKQGTNAVLRILLKGPGSGSVDGLTLSAPTVVAGLGIQRFRFGVNIIPGGEGSRIVGNFIGTNLAGTRSVANTGAGIHVDCHADVMIGGAARSDRNVISGNDDGIQLCEDVQGTRITGNLIGVGADGRRDVGNAKNGIIAFGTQDVVIGGDSPIDRNVIAFNSKGIALRTAGGVDPHGVRILGNSIYGNRSLGIDLQDDGVTPNDAGDGDVGANSLQNFPVIAAAIARPRRTIVRARLSSTPNTTFVVRFFIDRNGEREGKTPFATKTVTTGPGGTIEFLSRTRRVRPGRWITATATAIAAPLAETSEFSAPRRVRDPS